MYDDLSIEHFMEGLKKRNNGETEFHQSVLEVAESIIPYIINNPINLHLQDNSVLWKADNQIRRNFSLEFSNLILTKL
ncbi:MAG: hypothetical protein H8E70_03625 [Candidatus Marinimicrobia bacterium]|nr:hypothetical protein [Candidatus Neomarinimicrobiota bacterium]